jgi:hypothetical protein
MPQSGQAAGIRLTSSTVHAASPGETEKTLRLGAGAQDAGDFMPLDERGRSLAQARHRPTCTERQSEPRSLQHDNGSLRLAICACLAAGNLVSLKLCDPEIDLSIGDPGPQ